jgi:ribosomal protein L32
MLVKGWEGIGVGVLAASMACWNCGFKVLPGRYCLKCGKKN